MYHQVVHSLVTDALVDERRIYRRVVVYTGAMSKHLVDIDEAALRAARAQLGTRTIKETVNRALDRVGGDRTEAVRRSLDALAAVDLSPREDAWR